MDDATNLREKVAALRSPQTYEHSPRSVACIETHFAWVFLADEFAFKLKKPVRNEYVDLFSNAARRFNCMEEVRLNRRLAADVYLGVVPLSRTDEGVLRIGRHGPIVDWLVKMRRLPASDMLDAAMAAGPVDTDTLAAVGRMLADFYEVQPIIAFESHEYLSRMRFQLQLNRAELLAPDLELPRELVDSVVTAQMAACAAVEPQLRLRAHQSRIVEAHGDLRPEHICLAEPPCVIDSLEFSRDLRTLDPFEELAFLCVECTRLGQAYVGMTVTDAYRAHAHDVITRDLFDFYRSRRAAVRAKLIAWHVRDPSVSALANWREQSVEYLEVARDHALGAAGG